MRTNLQLTSNPLDKVALLRSHPFFRGLDNRIVERLIPHALTRKVKKGTLLFRKGDVGTNLYVVCAGAVRVSAPSDQGRDAVFNLIVPGEIFGEIAFLDGAPRTADAVMIESGELMVIERRDFLPLLRDYPELALRLLQILCGRLRHTSEQVEDIVFLGLGARLAKSLLYLYDHSSSKNSQKLKVTQREVSQLSRRFPREREQAIAQLATPKMGKTGTRGYKYFVARRTQTAYFRKHQ